MPITIEVCVDSLSGARLAQSLGADRLELCANLAIGGTTPSAGQLRAVRAAVQIPVHVLIRPRGGDFLYTADEIETMLAEIAFARAEGADGIVCGALTPQGLVDITFTRQLVQAAQPLPFTFHRAFDQCVAPVDAMAVLETLGVQHLLTSGQAVNAAAGLPVLQQLQTVSRSVSIMPGGGITPENIGELLDSLRPAEIHFSGTSRVPSGMKVKPSVRMGKEDPAEFALVTDPRRLGALIQAVRGWESAHI